MKINGRYIFLFFIATVVSWFLHEFSHWAVGEFLGYHMGMGLNQSFPLGDQAVSDKQMQMISAAGPLFTLLEALLIFFLMKNRQRPLLYPFLFICFYMRVLAMFISILNPNDEARISKYLGLGTYTLPVIMSAILFFLLYIITKRYRFTSKFVLLNGLLAIVFSSMIILADMYGKWRLI